MSKLLVRIARLILSLAALAVLAACVPASFYYDGSLQSLLATRQPIKTGSFVFGTATSQTYEAGNDSALPAVFALQDDGTYLLTLNTNATSLHLRFLGPIAGLYLMEVNQEQYLKLLRSDADAGPVEGRSTDAREFVSFIAKTDRDGSLLLADDDANKFMAEVIGDRLGIASEVKGETVMQLTEVPSINVELLQELLIAYRDQFTYEYHFTPTE